MKKSGYDAYIFMRPAQEEFHVPDQNFIWVGYDGSEIIAHKVSNGYSSLLGQADKKILEWLKDNQTTAVGMVPWGVGNHGGGPSRIDLENLNRIMKEASDFEIIHSTPEAYIKELVGSKAVLPRYDRDLNPWAVGCYTAQIRIKQKHRLLENELYMTEKMLANAAIQGILEYPSNEIKEALYDLLTSEFHDILTGTSVQLAEEASLRLLDHGLEIVSRLKTRAFFALSSGQVAAKGGEIPILVYNPHPFKVKEKIECEFMLADQNWDEDFYMPVIYKNDRKIASQTEKENSNINLDWRKRVVFDAELEPSCVNRFDCKLVRVARKPEPVLKVSDNRIYFRTNELSLIINCSTGLVDSYKVKGEEFLREKAFSLLVIEDNDDPWGMTVSSFRKILGQFELMSKEEGAEYSGLSGLSGLLPGSVRVIEDGEVRSVVEAVFKYGKSSACITYILPKTGTEVQLKVRLNWNEKSRMLKLSIPTVLEKARYLGQVAYGVEQLPDNGDEAVSQKWNAVLSSGIGRAFTCINDGVYGSDYKDGEFRISLLRSAGYCAHPIMDRPIMSQDRFSPRIDQGERIYSFRLNAGEATERLDAVDREALLFNERPAALSFFPGGEGIKPQAGIVLDDGVVQLTAFKKTENSEDYIIRLFEPTGKKRETTVRIPVLGLKKNVKLKGFEIKTYRLNRGTAALEEVDLMEKPLTKFD